MDIDAPGITWRVNVAANGKVAVAAYGDGTVRWHRMSDGEELLALLITPEPSGPEWVYWTPQGYFDASPGAERLIGWHLNQKVDQAALFYPVSKFRNRFYRPDVIDRVLDVLDVQKAVDAANAAANIAGEDASALVTQVAALPPTVTILSPSSGTLATDSVTVTVEVAAPSGGVIRELRTFRNGRTYPSKGGPQGTIRVGSKVQLVFDGLGDAGVTLGVQAIGDDGESEVAEVSLISSRRALDPISPTFASTDPSAPKPTLYALVVGISDYDLNRLDLRYAHQDALDMAKLLERQAPDPYQKVEMRVLIDKKASRQAILDGLSWLEREVTAHDVGLLFVAGHGYSSRRSRYYFLPRDGNPDNLRSTGITQEELRATLSVLGGRLAMVFLDTCYADASFGEDRGTPRSPADPNAIVSDLSSGGRGAVVFSSSQGYEVAVEKSAWKNGAFTEALADALTARQGSADVNGDGGINLSELDLFVTQRVKRLTDGSMKPILRKPRPGHGHAGVPRGGLTTRAYVIARYPRL